MTTSTEKIRFAGDVLVKKVEVVNTSGFGQDILNQISGIQIFESLFDPFITGVLIVDDTLDLINLFPLVGEEFLNLDIVTPTLNTINDGIKRSITGRFYIYKVTERNYIGDKRLTYKLHFISFEALVDLNKKLSQPFKGKCSDIAKVLMTSQGLETKKNYYIEPCSNSIKFISNFWSPVKCLNYLSERAINYKDSPTYYFFENRNGFNFASLQQLAAAANSSQLFTNDAYTRDFKKTGQNIKNIEEDYKRVTDVNVPVVYDYMDRIRNGTYSSRLITHDILTKRYNVKSYDSKKTFNREVTLNKNPLTSSKNIAFSDSAIMTKPLYNNNFTGYGDVTSSNYTQKRISRMNQFKSNSIEITVPGRTDYTVGQKVDLLFYKNVPLRKGESDLEHVDKVYSGKYLVSAINHFISRQDHECSMELVKDSYIINLNSQGN